MLPSSIRTFISFTHAPSTPLSVLVARATAWLIASSKPCSEMALSSVTLAMLIRLCLLKPSLLIQWPCATFTAPDPWRRPSCPWLYPCAGPSVPPPSCRYLRLENHRPPSRGPWPCLGLPRPCPGCFSWASQPSQRCCHLMVILTRSAFSSHKPPRMPSRRSSQNLPSTHSGE